MGSVTENDELFKNSIKYLHDISHMSVLKVPALKSFYSTKGRLMELRNGVYLPPNMTRTSVRCQKCFLNLLDGPANYRIKSEQKKSKFAKRVLAKSQNHRPLTKYQQKYLERLDNFKGNHLEITCKFCKKESLIKLSKPEKKMLPKVPAVSALSRKKKKMKKKDKFCGLNQEAVLSITPQNIRHLSNPDIISLDPGDKMTPRFKLSRKENQDKSQKDTTTKEKVMNSKDIFKKINKRLNKLGELLNNTSNSKNTPSSNLKHFLQGLES